MTMSVNFMRSSQPGLCALAAFFFAISRGACVSECTVSGTIFCDRFVHWLIFYCLIQFFLLIECFLLIWGLIVLGSLHIRLVTRPSFSLHSRPDHRLNCSPIASTNFHSGMRSVDLEHHWRCRISWSGLKTWFWPNCHITHHPVVLEPQPTYCACALILSSFNCSFEYWKGSGIHSILSQGWERMLETDVTKLSHHPSSWWQHLSRSEMHQTSKHHARM